MKLGETEDGLPQTIPFSLSFSNLHIYLRLKTVPLTGDYFAGWKYLSNPLSLKKRIRSFFRTSGFSIQKINLTLPLPDILLLKFIRCQKGLFNFSSFSLWPS
ncbi:MAG: hypothetical protein UU37_C0007G0008 [Candidatus Gottesmanbacteria bacterium GW2011_GWA2_41_12]|uniref:Uncharacterized protein n=1 Tax=Candidatus Gottesmanbacteria bacterium GW2011_GWA2_41_12 TaxID=1618440 RepID=A0A0G0UL86_9BACT|nr:MAG: hypothetical protein UU37_C0007G0008 [Candidatus Gottesmanbacteria bacterium GW2011_GWA2_41_12]